MKVAVLGAGAIGSMLGGLIKRHAPEVDVLLIARGEHGEAMRRQGGVVLEGLGDAVRAPLTVSDAAEDVAGSDYVLLTVKSHATEDAIRAAADHLGDAAVISIQNGVNQRMLSRYVRPDRLVAGMTATNMAITKPGTVAMQHNDVTMIGPGAANGSMQVVRAAADMLRRSRLKIAVNENILGAQYNKLVFNTLGSASALSASDFLGEAVLHARWRNVVGIPLRQECLKVFRDAKVQLSRIPSASDVYRFGRLLQLLNQPVLGRLAGLVVRRVSRRKSIVFSLYVDLVRGKPTEVDFINGEIAELAKTRGTSAPLNAKVVELAHELERRRDGRFYDRDEIISIFERVRG